MYIIHKMEIQLRTTNMILMCNMWMSMGIRCIQSRLVLVNNMFMPMFQSLVLVDTLIMQIQHNLKQLAANNNLVKTKKRVNKTIFIYYILMRSSRLRYLLIVRTHMLHL